MPLNVDEISTGSLSVNGTEITENGGLPKYKVYTALLTQNIDEPPVANILENTIGDIVWTRNSEGIYYGTLTGAFTDKTFLQGPWASSGKIYGVPAYSEDTTNVGTFIMITKEDSNYIRVSTLAFPEAFGDGLLLDFPIEIRVYN